MEASVLFIPALSSFSRTVVETLKMLNVTTLMVAFKATITRAVEGHVAERKTQNRCVCLPSGDSHTGRGDAFRADWKNGKTTKCSSAD